MPRPDRSPLGPPPPFDFELTAGVGAITRSLAPGGVTFDFIPTLRSGAGVILTPDDAALTRGGAFSVRRVDVPVGGAPDVALLVLQPTRAASRAIIYYVHGGGMVAGDARNGISEVLDWAEILSLTVVSIDYRLAPENPHPAPLNDCVAGLGWCATNARELGCDSGRIVVAGASAGGGLAASLALFTRDHNGPAIHGTMLIAPMLDDRNDSSSSWQLEGVGVWDRNSNATGWSALLGTAAGDPGVSPYASPARAESLAGLPPTLIDVGSAETFRDEAVNFAQRIWSDGGVAELYVWAGAFHGFTAYVPDALISRQALRSRLSWLERLLASSGGGDAPTA